MEQPGTGIYLPPPSIYIRFSVVHWILWLIAASMGMLTANPGLTVLSIIILPFLITMLWRKGEPALIFFIAAFQWLTVTAKVFYANFLNKSAEKMFGGPEINTAIFLSLIGIVVLSAGMRLAMTGLNPQPPNVAMEDVGRFSPKKILGLYFLAFVYAFFSRRLAAFYPSATQIFDAFANVKLVFLYLLAYTVLKTRCEGKLLLIAIASEILIGVSGYFASFRYGLYLLAIVLPAVGYRMNFRIVSRAVIIVSLALYLGTVWTAVKSEYRKFISDGYKAQVVKVPLKERLEKIVHLTFRLKSKNMSQAFETLVQRIAYVDIFANVIQVVPKIVPHENGGLWGGAVQHVLCPRIFFPNKPILSSDSEITMKYTLLKFAGEEDGVSVSIGYMGESYIDYGERKMFVPVFILGLLWGWIYKFLVKLGKWRTEAYAVATAVLVNAASYETFCAKLLGGILMNFIVMTIVLKWLLPWLKSVFLLKAGRSKVLL